MTSMHYSTTAGDVSDGTSITFTGTSGWDFSTSTVYYTWPPQQAEPQPEVRRMKKSEKYLVVARESGAVVTRETSESDAIDEAKALAEKHGDEYIVFKALKRYKPKADVEESEG